MAASPISIGIVSDPSGAIKGIGATGDALTQLQSKVAGVTDDAATQGSQLEQIYRQQTQVVQEEKGKQVEAEVLSSREVNNIQKEAVKSGAANIATTVAQSASALQDIGTNAASTVGNVAASVAGLSMNPIVAAIGAGVGIVAGLVSGLIAQANTETEAYDKTVQNLTDDFIASGKDGSASIGYIVQQMKALADGTSDTGLSLDDIRNKAKEIGVPFASLAQTYAGGTLGLKGQIQAVKELASTSEATVRQTATEGGLAAEQAHDAAAKQAKDAEGQLTDLEKIQAANKEAAKQAKIYAESGIPEMVEKQGLQDQLNKALNDSATATTGYLNTEKGIFNVGDYIKAMQAREKALDDYRQNLETSGLSTDAKTFLDAQGQQTAALLLAGYEKASPAQKAALNQIWTENGEANAGTYAGSFEKNLPKSINGPTVKLPSGSAAAAAWLRDLQKTLNSSAVQVGVTIHTPGGNNIR